MEERRENKQKKEEAREEGYLYIMLISDDGRVIFRKTLLQYYISFMEYSLELLTNNLKHATCSYTPVCSSDAPCIKLML